MTKLSLLRLASPIQNCLNYYVKSHAVFDHLLRTYK